MTKKLGSNQEKNVITILGKKGEPLNPAGGAYKRALKELQQKSQPVTNLEESQNPSDEVLEAESVSIESHNQNATGGTFKDILSRASSNVKNLLTDEEEVTPKKSSRVSKNSRDEFSVLVVSIVTLVVALIRIRESMKPNQDEIGLFSSHVSGIMLRHLPISNKLSADALDIIGILAVTATWYSRIAMIEGEVQPLQPRTTQTYRGEYTPQVPTNASDNGADVATPIEQGSEHTADWLARAAKQGEGHYE